MLMVDEAMFAPTPPRMGCPATKKKRGRRGLSLAEARLEHAVRIYSQGPPLRSARGGFVNSVCSRASWATEASRPFSEHQACRREAPALTTQAIAIPAEAEAPAAAEESVPPRVVTASAFRKYMEDMDAQLTEALGGLTQPNLDCEARFAALEAKHQALRAERAGLHEKIRGGSPDSPGPALRMQGIINETHDSVRKLRQRAQRAEQLLREQRDISVRAERNVEELTKQLAKAQKVVKEQREAAKKAQQQAKADRQELTQVRQELQVKSDHLKRLRDKVPRDKVPRDKARTLDSNASVVSELSVARQRELEVELDKARTRAAQQSQLVSRLRELLSRVEGKVREARLSTAEASEVEGLRATVAALEEHIAHVVDEHRAEASRFAAAVERAEAESAELRRRLKPPRLERRSTGRTLVPTVTASKDVVLKSEFCDSTRRQRYHVHDSAQTRHEAERKLQNGQSGGYEPRRVNSAPQGLAALTEQASWGSFDEGCAPPPIATAPVPAACSVASNLAEAPVLPIEGDFDWAAS